MKDWFKARNIWGAAIQALSDEEAGRLVKALWGYTMTGVIHEPQGAEKSVFALIMMTLTQDEEKDNDISEKRAIAGAKGGKQKVANEANATNDVANEANATKKNKNKNKEEDIKERDIHSEYPERKRFTPPSLEEVTEYCKSRNNGVNPQMFIDFYSAKGWKVGSQPMKNWQACVRTWEQRDTASGSGATKKVVAQDYSQRDYCGVQQDILRRQEERLRRRMSADNFVQRDYSNVDQEIISGIAEEISKRG